jgi:hypothetical protein
MIDINITLLQHFPELTHTHTHTQTFAVKSRVLPEHEGLLAIRRARGSVVGRGTML